MLAASAEAAEGMTEGIGKFIDGVTEDCENPMPILGKDIDEERVVVVAERVATDEAPLRLHSV